MNDKIKCITFDKEAQDALPEHIKAKMKADREKARSEQKPPILKYSAFIENTPEVRMWLESIGYEPFEVETKLENPNHYRKILAFVDERWYTLASDNVGIDSKTGKRMPHVINCRSNPQLFQAVTAMRDDSDYMQWFHYNGIWGCWKKHCKVDDAEVFQMSIEFFKGTKATLEELIEHFK